MPYSLSLQEYMEPGFVAEPPEGWVARLREISAVTDRLQHLRFRRFDPHPSWAFHQRPIWVLYACTPKHLVSAERAEQFREHWSELPSDRQAGRKAMVSDYQHFLWHTQGVEAMPFWVLQGPWGGTAAAYTPREKRYLDAMNAISEPFPLGFFPACEFNELAVQKIQARDRFLLAGKNIDALERMDRPAALRAEDEAAERLFRQTFLDNWFETIQPQVEFMQSYLRTSAADMDLPRATREQANAVTEWQDHYREFGVVPGGGIASSRRSRMLVS